MQDKIRTMKNIHVLPTDKLTKISMSEKTNTMVYNKDKHDTLVGFINQNIYITSDEEIKDGDWFLTDDKRIEKCASDWKAREWHKKIILTTDQDLIKDGVQAIDDEFLEWFVKNPSCEYVKTEIVEFGFDEVPICTYEIIIPKEEVKQETLEEAFNNEIKNKYNFTIKDISPSDKLDIGGNIIEDKHYFENDIEMTKCIREMAFTGRIPKRWSWFVAKISDLYKWQQERMYSEEEVLDLLYKRDLYLISKISSDLTKEWFEQFKNK